MWLRETTEKFFWGYFRCAPSHCQGFRKELLCSLSSVQYSQRPKHPTRSRFKIQRQHIQGGSSQTHTLPLFKWSVWMQQPFPNNPVSDTQKWGGFLPTEARFTGLIIGLKLNWAALSSKMWTPLPVQLYHNTWKSTAAPKEAGQSVWRRHLMSLSWQERQDAEKDCTCCPSPIREGIWVFRHVARKPQTTQMFSKGQSLPPPWCAQGSATLSSVRGGQRWETEDGNSPCSRLGVVP